jgi:hypothetical protein
MQVVKVVLLLGIAIITHTAMVQHTRVHLTDTCTTSGEIGQVALKVHLDIQLIACILRSSDGDGAKSVKTTTLDLEVTHITTGDTERPPSLDGTVSMSLLKDLSEEAITTSALTEHLATR